MKLEKFNAWLSFFGNVAILLGLVAVAVEISDNTSAVRAQELGAQREDNLARQLAMLDPDTRAMYTKSLFNPAELTFDELQGMTAYLSLRVGGLERAYLSYEDGIVREVDWEGSVVNVPIYLGTPFGRVWWEVARNDYAHRPEFVSAIDRAIDESPIVPDDEFLIDLQARAQRLVP